MSSDLGQSSVKLMRAAAACACTRGLLWSIIVGSRVEITWEKQEGEEIKKESLGISVGEVQGSTNVQ